MIAELDDDDTLPTENADVLAELVGSRSVPPLTVTSFGAATTPGLRRQLNEDAWGAAHGVFAVADGMGGSGGGALAARTAIDRLLRAVADHGSATRLDWPALIRLVSAQVVAAGREHGVERLGCTLLVAASRGPLVTVVHVGDSRAYRLTRPVAGDDRPARFDLLTGDHNVRAELLAAGLDIGEYRERGVAPHGLTSYIGLEHGNLRIDVVDVSVRSTDRMLLCTDGIHRPLAEAALRDALGGGTCRDAAARLASLADESGGRDNATALVFEIGVGGDPA